MSASRGHPAQPGTRSAADRFECHLDIGDPLHGQTAIDVLSTHTGLSRTAVKHAMRKGAVWLSRQGTRRLRRADRALHDGDALHLYHDPAVLAAEPPEAALIADEQAFSVWYKPAGMLSQGSKWGDHCTLARWAETHLEPQRPAFITHRLDRAASGLMIIAHRRRTAAAISALFRQRTVEKTYTAVVHGRLDAGLTIERPLDGRTATSHVDPIAYDAPSDRSLLRVRIETGRKHQIRRHLSDAGLPIVGDRLHGLRGDEENLCLAASELSFIAPGDDSPQRYRLPKRLWPAL